MPRCEARQVTTDGPLTVRPQGRPRGRPSLRPDRRPQVALLAVAAVYAAVALVIGWRTRFGWDESVYISQVARGVPAAFFSAPRARGISWLVAPVASFTTSVAAVRIYLGVLAGAGLVAAFWPWLRLRRGAVVPLAAAVFAVSWQALFYAPQAMPNLWVALPAVAATGWFIRAAGAEDGGDRRLEYAGVAVAVCVATIVRPSDGSWLALPLLAAVIGVRHWRKAPLGAAVLGGAVLGWLPWVVEALARFDGPLHRLRLAADIQGGTSPQFAVVTALRGVDGPLLCRPCDRPVPTLGAVVWVVGALALVTAVVTARRYGRAASTWLPTVVGGSLAVPYFFLVYYTAARFLLPAYAVLAVPVAEGLLVWGGSLASVTGRRAAAVAVAAVVVVFAGTQLRVAADTTTRNTSAQRGLTELTRVLQQRGLRPPCGVGGPQAPLVAFPARCVARLRSGRDPSGTPRAMIREARTERVAFVWGGAMRRTFWEREGWQRIALRHGRHWWTAYLSPRP